MHTKLITSNKDHSKIPFLSSFAICPITHQPVITGENYFAICFGETMLVKSFPV